MESPMLTISEIATYLKVGKDTIYSLVNSNDFPAIKIKGSWRIIKTELDLWIKQQFTHKNL